jgi:diguanylate cyclase (GGDEF)-like protein/PAS domain S-box-containing protein
MHLDKIHSIISRDVVTLEPKESLRTAVERMNFYKVGCVVVVEDKRPAGILTERDIVRLISNNIDINITTLMSVMNSPVIAVSEEAELPEVANLMVINDLRRLVVVDEGRNIIGIITQTDIIKNLNVDSFVSLRKMEQIMKRKIVSMRKEDSLLRAVELMAQNRISCVPVVEDNRPVGIITERDITRAIAENSALNNNIKAIMTSPVLTVSKDVNLYDATRLMEENKFRRLVVVDPEGYMIGIATQSDIIRNIREDYMELLKNMLKEKSRELVESEIKYRTLVERSLEGIIIIQEGLIKFVNPTLLKILNYDRREMIGIDILRFLFPDDRELLSESLNKFGDSQQVESTLELRMMHKNGEVIHMEILSTQIQYEGTPAILATLRNITERKKAESELKRLVITDDLTGLFNQRYFYIQLVKEIERAKRHNRPVSMLLIDIDMFKDFNDTYGHWEGDYVLKKIGEILTKNVREIDMAFRYGGEEFAVLLPDTIHADAVVAAERIRKAVAQTVFYPFTLDGHPDIVSKTVSTGVTEFRHEDNMKSFLKRVDNALYQAKKSGRNMVVSLV